MGLLTPNPAIGILQGTVGDSVFVPTKDGKIRVQHRPVREAEFTAGELKGQALMAEANRYVTRIRQEREHYAVYQNAARLAGKRACDLARSDIYHPPVVRLTGVLIEERAAMLDEVAAQWVYVAKVPVPAGQTVIIHVAAVDRPGNVASKILDHALI